MSFTFNSRDADALVRVVDLYRSGRLDAIGEEADDVPRTCPETYIGKTQSGGVPARSGSAAGTAPVNVYNVDFDGNMTDASFTVDAINIAESAVAGDTWVIMTREKFSNQWLVIVEDCGT